MYGTIVPAHPLTSDCLSEQVVLLTGAGDGIGKATALQLAACGAELLLLGRTEAKLAVVYDAIVAAKKVEPTIITADLTKIDAAAVAALHDGINKAHGRLDALIHNAALCEALTPTEHIDVAQWLRTVHVNLTMPFVLTKALLPLLRQAKHGHIVAISSTAGRRGLPYFGAYAAAKYGLEGFIQTLASELGDSTVAACSYNPGPTRTGLRKRLYPAESGTALGTPEAAAADIAAILLDNHCNGAVFRSAHASV